MPVSSTSNKPDDLEWVQYSNNDVLNEEGFVGKFVRKTKENPFVPIGAVATIGCLAYGLVSFRRGDSRMQQIMMRSRVVAQGFTVAALCIGVFLTTASKLRSKAE